ncbi:MAG: hypothetical protein M1275_03190 [Patescibacteria group bacterium]|nr:hypothetical protein [Patescibacteria group bacterium]
MIDAETQNQLNKITARLEALEKKPARLIYPLDNDSKKAIEIETDKFMLSKIFDLIWKKSFHFLTMFDSIGGWDNTAGTTQVSGSKVLFTTGATSGNSATQQKTPADQKMLNFSRKIYFRTAFQVAATSAQTGYLVLGKAVNATGDKYFGFKFINGSLYGCASNNGISNEQTKLLQSISASTVYEVEARYLPGDKILFFVNATPAASEPSGSITSGIPNNTDAVVTNLAYMSITTNENVAKTMEVSYFEMMQFINITL